jgi:hypothetical protein
MRLRENSFAVRKPDVIIRRKIYQILGYWQLAQSVVGLALLEFLLK